MIGRKIFLIAALGLGLITEHRLNRVKPLGPRHNEPRSHSFGYSHNGSR